MRNLAHLLLGALGWLACSSFRDGALETQATDAAIAQGVDDASPVGPPTGATPGGDASADVEQAEDPTVGAGDAAAGDAASPTKSGLEQFCDHYKTCGGTYYATAAKCVSVSESYWGACRRSKLDAYGACMVKKQGCSGWNPDAYNPAGGVCAAEWAALKAASPC